MKIGFFPLTADLLHVGHILALEEAKKHCDYLIAGLNCKPENKNPVQSVYERWVQLKAVKYVDEVIVYSGKEDIKRIIGSLHYDVRFLGSDYIGGEWDGKNEEEKLKIQPYFIDRSHGMSSTNLKKRIIEACK